MLAVGTLTGRLRDSAGKEIAEFENLPAFLPFMTPTAGAQATPPRVQQATTCPILTLHTGPIMLNLLGLVINVSPIDLSISAQRAPGNLLGNLLCDIANLLNANPLTPLQTLLAQLVVLLNQITQRLAAV